MSLIVVKKFDPAKSYQCIKCGDGGLKDIMHHEATDKPIEDDSFFSRKTPIEHISMHCKRCGYEIGLFLPLNLEGIE